MTFAVIAAFRVASAASMLDDELDIELELTLIAFRAVSVLEDELERYVLAVCCVVIFAFVPAIAVSMLADATERFTEEVC